MNRRNIFITGGSGYIGNLLIAELLKISDFNLYILCRDISKIKNEWLKNEKINIIQAALENFELPPNIEFYAVAHLAAYTKNTPKDVLFKTNIDGTKRLVEVFKARNLKKFIHLSSVLVFAGHLKKNNLPILNSFEYSAQDDYGLSKIKAEKIIKNADNLPYIIIRSGYVYDENRYIPIIKERLKKLNFKIVITKKNNYWHTTHSSKLISLIVQLLQDDKISAPKILFAVDDQPILIKKFYNEICAELNVKRPLYLSPAVFDILLKFNNIFNKIFKTKIDIKQNVIAQHPYSEIYSND